jgi:hypothetical protein
MIGRRVRGAVVPILGAAAWMAACETTRPAPYFLVPPSSIAPSVSSGLTRWDSAIELRQWVENPLTEGPFSVQSEDGVDFTRVELRPGVSSQINGPNLQPVFAGLRSVRVRARYFPTSADPAGVLNNFLALVAPTIRDDPSNPLIPAYFTRAAATAGIWQVLELLPETDRGYPAVVDARWLYLIIGRSGQVVVDIDWIELVR